MYNKLNKIFKKPEAFEFYTASDLWTDKHTANEMLKYHLNKDIDVSSRNHEFIRKSAEWMISEFGIGTESEVIDFGCGPGLYTFIFAESGANVTGVDFSENSLRYAKEKANSENKKIDYIHCNYLEFETERRFDLITMIMCDFCALSPEQRKIMLQKFRDLLKPEGKLILDVYTLDSFEEKQEYSGIEKNFMNNFWSEEDYYCFINNFKYEKEKVTLDKYTIFTENSEKIVYNWLQYFDKNAIEKEFSDNGLKISGFFADVSGNVLKENNKEMAILASKMEA